MREMTLEFTFLGLLLLALLVFSTNGYARVNGPPPLPFHGEPEVVVIPGTYVYYSPDVQADLFFYHGYWWYRPVERGWFRSLNYNGPWVPLTRRSVPQALLQLPPDYRAATEYRRIPYRELHRNWQTWEREKYWESHNWGRRGPEEREHGISPKYGDEHGRGFDRDRERHDFDRDRER